MPAFATAPLALFEDNLSAEPSGLLLNHHLQTIDCHDATEASAFFSTLDQHTHAGHWIALIAHYELGSAFETRIAATGQSPLRSSRPVLARALIFAEAIRLNAADLAAWWQVQLNTLTQQQRDAGLLHLSPTLDASAYMIKAQRILDYIAAGDCYQVNITFPMRGQAFGHPLALYAKLRAAQPVKHGALIFDGDECLLSRSPELFFERNDARITCRPMKGTAPRDNNAEQDAAHALALQHSEKDRAENIMIVDLIRNDLGRLANAGEVHVRKLFELERYSTLFQLTSTIDAEAVTAPLGDVFKALFPCGSVTGAPKVRAMQIIHEQEAEDRGPYCGAIGWIKPDGDCRFNVPIRTLRLQTDGTCRMDVGSGIVADSQPATEYDECLIKARFATDDGLQLIETLRCEAYRSGDASEAFPLLAWHLQRLARSASALHFGYDEEATHDALIAQAATLTPGLYRVRLLLSRCGRIEISAVPLDELPTNPSLILSSQRIDADDPRLQHKTTARSFYDAALRDAIALGHFDVIFLNTRGEVCEGARSNIFIERHGRLLTPPLSCGLLPGVLRAQMLASGSAREAVLTLDDLHNAEGIFVGNALRGLLQVRLTS